MIYFKCQTKHHRGSLNVNHLTVMIRVSQTVWISHDFIKYLFDQLKYNNLLQESNINMLNIIM